jgi:predicted NAD-dependent protein-ADP-ribosyltransferase YbiA (DUF1768 family)
MKLVLLHKFHADPKLAQLLLSTHPHPLASIKPDRYWGMGFDGQGQNKLALLLMEVREELKALVDGGMAVDPPPHQSHSGTSVSISI